NTGGRYHLNAHVVTVDWWIMAEHYAKVATATDDQQRVHHLTSALSAGHGPLAGNADYEWIDTDREVVRRHQIRLYAHAATLLADTDPQQAWLLLEQGCDLDPLSEELGRRAMRQAAVLGHDHAVRRRLATLRESLRDNGLELDQATRVLAKDLLRQLNAPSSTHDPVTLQGASRKPVN
ncbi:MAG TPA: bacterial transcriptional activator domain-containing protein, partial [Candidatus Limnocylindrales bacterium]|nr:bacterial transcriptional activator domain-containing protein [Candidatus Limnocylindrales bacterium]